MDNVIDKFFKRIYFNQNYNPIKIKGSSKENPKAFFIEDIPHISYKDAYCHTAILEMLQRGKNTIGYYNWVTGFTYGAYFNGEVRSFMPYQDPEVLFQERASYLGLDSKYYVTKNSSAFINEVERLVANKTAVKVPVNYDYLKNLPTFDAHTELIVGYDEKHFYYLEPGEEDRNIPNSNGKKILKLEILNAIESLSKEFAYPWKYSFMIFKDCEGNKSNDLKEIIIKNSRLLKGKSSGPYAEGVQALEKFSDCIKNYSELEEDRKYIISALNQCRYTRKSNGEFLKDFLPDIKEISNNFLESAKLYEDALKCFSDSPKNHFKAGNLVDEACNYEELSSSALRRYYNKLDK